jgi:RNA polymerase sigma-70 factor (ECF subfamily)
VDYSRDKDLFEEIRKSNKKAFTDLFHAYYSLLCGYAFTILKEHDSAGEIVQDLFVRLWEKRESIHIETSLKSYLFIAVKNRCINALNQSVSKRLALNDMISENQIVDIPDPDLLIRIKESIEALPEKRRQIFLLSREKGMKYHEIAKELQISIKTVEAQMGLALKTLREMLGDYLS